jgi:hypothetical protein
MDLSWNFPQVIDSEAEFSVLNRIVLNVFKLKMLCLKFILDALNQS